MLDRMTGGLYRSTPHRVRNPAPRDRLSFPFFFDPNFFARVQPIEHLEGELPPDRSIGCTRAKKFGSKKNGNERRSRGAGLRTR